MAVGVAESERAAFQSARSSAVSTESGVELSQTSPEQSTQHYPARNSRPSLPCTSPHVSSRLLFGARNENVRISSSATENSNPGTRQMFPGIISKLSRHPWTESKEFIELWSDIPSKTDNRIQTDQEQKANDGSAVSNVVADSNNDSFRKSWVLSKHPWTASTEFVELWSDIPSEFDTRRNPSEERKELDKNDAAPSSNATALYKDMIDSRQCLTTTSGIFRNSFTEFEKLTEVSSIAPDDSISNQNYSNCPEEDKVVCCRLFSECFRDFQNFSTSFRNHIFILVMEILLSLVPISAFFMGAIHIGTCPANEGVTYLVYITGIAGVFLIGCHIAYHFTKDRKEEIRRGIRTFQVITAILLMIEMLIFYSMSPSFENSENYCDETFYNYTFYMNIAAAGIVFLSVLLQYTSC